MAAPVLLCTDGSELSLQALAAGMALLAPDAPYVLVTVAPDLDPTLVGGTGFAGGTMTPAELAEHDRAVQEHASALLGTARATLGIPDAPGKILRGSAGPTIVAVADELGAAAVIVGTRGRSGLKRAVLGSVSDHVVRHATCPVLVVGDRG